YAPTTTTTTSSYSAPIIPKYTTADVTAFIALVQAFIQVLQSLTGSVSFSSQAVQSFTGTVTSTSTSPIVTVNNASVVLSGTGIDFINLPSGATVPIAAP